MGTKDKHYFTNEEFISLMKSIFNPSGTYTYEQLQFYNYDLPIQFPRFDLEDWMEYSGAEFFSEAEFPSKEHSIPQS